MGRGKIDIKRIENTSSRQVTFCKRRGGLLKKARELAVLCDAKVGLIVLSSSGKLFEYGSSSMKEILETHYNFSEAVGVQGPWSHIYPELMTMRKEFARLQQEQRHFNGQELDALSIEELRQLEKDMTLGLRNVRRRKEELISGHIDGLIRKVQGYPSVLQGPCYSEFLSSAAREVVISGPLTSNDDGQDSRCSETLLQLGLSSYHNTQNTSKKTSICSDNICSHDEGDGTMEDF